MSLENIIPVQIWLEGKGKDIMDEKGEKYTSWHIKCAPKFDKKGKYISEFKPSEIKSVGRPFLISSSDCPEKVKLGDWVGWEMETKLEKYLKRAYAEELIAKAKKTLYLGYLEGPHHDLITQSGIPNIYTTNEKTKIIPCQFFHLIE